MTTTPSPGHSIVKIMEVVEETVAVACNNEDAPTIANSPPPSMVKVEVVEETAVVAIENNVPSVATLPGAELSIVDATNTTTATASSTSLASETINAKSKRARLAEKGCEEDKDRQAIIEALCAAIREKNMDDVKSLFKQMDKGYSVGLADKSFTILVAEREVLYMQLAALREDLRKAEDLEEKITILKEQIANYELLETNISWIFEILRLKLAALRSKA